jgi:hypothetical protein
MDNYLMELIGKSGAVRRQMIVNDDVFSLLHINPYGRDFFTIPQTTKDRKIPKEAWYLDGKPKKD